jgi:hypothetical protein
MVCWVTPSGGRYTWAGGSAVVMLHIGGGQSVISISHDECEAQHSPDRQACHMGTMTLMSRSPIWWIATSGPPDAVASSAR